MRSTKGISLVTLSIAIVVLVIITSILVYNAKDGVRIKNLESLYNDIATLNDKVASYYLEYGDIPGSIVYANRGDTATGSKFLNTLETANQDGASVLNPNDGNTYYVLDLQALEGVTLNYGRDYEKVNTTNDVTSLTDIYVINKVSHTIYYVQGVTVEKITYYTDQTAYSNVDLKVIPIYTAEQMSWVGDGQRHSIEQEYGIEYTFSLDGIYSLQNDIDLSSVCYKVDGTPENDVSWKQRGTDEAPFSGMILGNGYEIQNIYINNSDNTRVGLIRTTLNVKIKDLGVTGEIICSGGSDTAGIIGIARGNTTIENCYNKVSITRQGGSSIGGIIGCANSLSSEVKLVNCYNEGNIEGGTSTGGLVGSMYGKISIENSYNKGNVTNVSSHGATLGGLIGREHQLSDINNIIIIKNSYNEGNVINIAENAGDYIFVGGILGYSNDHNTKVTIENCYNTGTIASKAEFVSYESTVIGEGGISGRICTGNGIILSCYNTGEIINGNRTGGILGSVRGSSSTNMSNVKIINSYNTGNILHENVIQQATSGGIINMGYYANLDIINCYNTGNVKSYEVSTGIISTMQYSNTNIINCYNTGKMEGTSTAGITQYTKGTDAIKVSDAYYLDNVDKGVNGLTPDPSTKMTEQEMKSSTFITTLNNNKNNINLADYNLGDYELATWKQSSRGYPGLEY